MLPIQEIVEALRSQFLRGCDVHIACRGIAALAEWVSCTHKNSQARSICFVLSKLLHTGCTTCGSMLGRSVFSGLTAYRS